MHDEPKHEPRLRKLGLMGALLVASTAGCGAEDAAAGAGAPVVVTPAPLGEPYARLGAWHLFSNARRQQPAERVEPYEVSSPLWSDATSKHRFMYLPEGSQIGYQAEDKWSFPVGAILVKTFAYPVDARDETLGERLLETRLLVHEPDGWVPLTYVWDEQSKEAQLEVAGTNIAASWIDAQGVAQTLDYSVPNTNQCKECHGEPGTAFTLGGRTRQLNRTHDYGGGAENQIDHLAGLGWLDQVPPGAEQRETLPEPFGAAPIAERARSYLDANCAHCHEPGNAAASSGVYFSWPSTGAGSSPASFGVCKTPTSAGGATCGLSYDIVPGAALQSILICRVSSREPKVQMPPLATKLVHQAGVELLSEWVAGISEPPCQ